MKEKVKIGIVIGVGDLPLWIYRVIERISAGGFAEIKLIIHPERRITADKASGYSFFYDLHLKLDQLFLRKRIDFNKKVDVSKLLQGIEKVTLYTDHSQQKDDSHILPHEISQHSLDIILNLSPIAFAKSDGSTARYGIWQYWVAGKIATCDDRICYWEFVKKKPVAEAVLVSSNNYTVNEVVIHRSWIPLNYNSMTINSDHAHELYLIKTIRLIRNLHHEGIEHFNTLVRQYNKNIRESVGLPVSPPSNLQSLFNMVIVFIRFLHYRFVFTIRWKWFLLYRFDQNQFPDTASKFMTLLPPKDRFWADPFVISRDNKINIFIEEVIYGKKGHITLLQLDKSGKLLQTRKILERPYHLSYPFVFEHNNAYYMIPETCENKTIEIYRCDEFPTKWSFVMNLQEDIRAKDTTVFFYNNKWWLFTAINEFENFEDYVELHLYYSDDLFSAKWIPHPGNPVNTDVRNARPAGKIFMENGKIFRPSQDCSIRYGKALNLNEITTLSETSYEETLVFKTEATWFSGLKGTHTYNFDDNFSVIDAYKY